MAAHGMAAPVGAVAAWRLAGGGRRRGGLAGLEGGGGPREEGKREQAGCKNFQGKSGWAAMAIGPN
jgi:hypothetical protein